MPSVSSLIKSADARRQKIAEQEDSLAAYKWDLSSKSYDDYLEYKKYLEDRAGSASDPSKQLSYTKKVSAANRSFTSHEIQRQTIDVLEGNSTNQNKYNNIVDLYSYAVANDDLDLAQSLHLQLDNLDRTIQGERQATQALAERMASERVTDVKDYIDLVINGKDLPSGALSLKELNDIYKKNGDEGLNDIGKAAAEALGTPGQASYWDMYKGIVDDVLATYQMATAGLDPVNAAKLQKEYNDIIDGSTTFNVPGLGKISYQDINDAVDAQRAGQNLFVSSQRDGQNVFKKTKVSDYVWRRDVNGNYSLLKVRNEVGDNFDSASQVLKRDAKGNVVYKNGKAEALSYRDALKQAGFDVLDTEDGRLVVRGTTNTGELGIPGISGNQSFDVVIGEDGQVKLLAQDENGNQSIYGIDLSQDGTFKVNQVKQEDVSIFGDKYSAPTKEGVALTKAIIGQDNNNDVPIIGGSNDPLKVLNSVDPYGRPINTTDILNTGNQIAKLRALGDQGVVADFGPISKYGSLELQNRINTAGARIQAANVSPQGNVFNTQNQQAPQIQATPTFNLNQTPVPFNAKLRVTKAAPAPTPTVTVAQPTQRITSVSTATPTVPSGGLKVVSR